MKCQLALQHIQNDNNVYRAGNTVHMCSLSAQITDLVLQLIISHLHATL